MSNHQRLHATDVLNGRPHVLRKRRKTTPHSTAGHRGTDVRKRDPELMAGVFI
jgi:hypothetical protein